MTNRQSKHPLDLIHRRLWADDLHEIVRELQRGQLRLVTENDVLDFLFSRHRQDPETKELVRQIRRSLARALKLNRRIVILQRKHAAEMEDALYTDEDEDPILGAAILEKQLLTQH